jgi:hypothetical protein
MKCPNFDVDACTKFFGPLGNANLLVVRAQVHMALGRLVFCTTWSRIIRIALEATICMIA